MKIEFSERARAIIGGSVKENNPFDFNTAPPQRGGKPDPPAPTFDFNNAPPQADPAVTVSADTCRARCRKSGLCYARAAFDAKMGKGAECNPWGCEYLEMQNGG